MSFQSEIYPYRTNRVEFTSRLLRNLDSWTEVTNLPISRERPGFVQRCQISGHSFECNYTPAWMDKRRIRALLKAWSRQISDRYLDLNLVSRGETRSNSTTQIAFDNIRRNKSAGGAVSFIMNELEWERTNNSPTFFGQNMYDNYGYNTYFTYLLRWGDLHCYGLIRELQMQEARHSIGGGSSLHPVWRAAKDWLYRNRNNGVYAYYNLQY